RPVRRRDRLPLPVGRGAASSEGLRPGGDGGVREPLASRLRLRMAQGSTQLGMSRATSNSRARHEVLVEQHGGMGAQQSQGIVLFDVEIVFLYPWAVALHRLRAFGLAEMAVFASLLLLGYAYAWRKGALNWE